MIGAGSVVTIQIGQCGNQVGCEFFRSVREEALHSKQPQDSHSTFKRFFRPSGPKSSNQVWTARGVLIDMEPKVIQETMAAAAACRTWKYDTKRQFFKQSGSANNWAYGYNVHGPQSEIAIADIIRKEAECCDNFGGFLVLQSLAGGTGSGVGAYTSELLRDQYPEAFILNQVVWPYETGEVIVQNYNSVLSLACLNEVSDGILSIENDQISQICHRLLKVKRPSFPDLNRVIARNLSTLLLPSYFSSARGVSVESKTSDARQKVNRKQPFKHSLGAKTWMLGEAIEHLFAHPGYKLSVLKSIPQVASHSKEFESSTWSYLTKHLLQMQVADACMEEGINWGITLPTNNMGFNVTDVNKSIASILIMRGAHVFEPDVSGFSHPALFADWTVDPLMVLRHPAPFDGAERSAAIWSNSQSILRPLQRIVAKAYEMYCSTAYLHHYTQYGLDSEHFDNTFAGMEQIILNYQNLSM